MNSTVRSFFLGIVQIHILHHAAQEPVFGLWLKNELERHGYKISPGTLYPVFHSLEKDGQLKSRAKVVNGKVRKYYSATAKGRATLMEARTRIRELLDELMS
jgi:PadR family transcriptional regulator